MMKIAIIGFGAAGFSCFTALVKQKLIRSQALIDIYQPKAGLLTGLAYQDDADYICINHHHDFISTDIDDPHGFTHWLEKEKPEYLAQYKGYQPRRAFGEFMRHQFVKLCQSLESKPRIFDQTVISISGASGQYQLHSASGQIVTYDKIIIATGHAEQQNVYGLEGEKYIHSPYPIYQKLTTIGSSDTVAIIGMGLTGVDAVVGLYHQGHQGKIFLVSRTGLFSAKRFTPAAYKCKYFTSAAIRKIAQKKVKIFRNIVNTLDKELREAIGISLRELYSTTPSSSVLENRAWQNVLYSCNKEVEEAWSILTRREKKFFFGRFFRKWLDTRVGVAPHNYDLVMSLKEKGQLSFIPGLQAIKPGFSIITENKKIKTDWVINAMGSPRFLNESPPVFIKNLVAQNLTCYNEFGGINVDFNSSELINSSNELQKGLYAIGEITAGVFLYTPITDHLVRHADKIAKNICLT